MKFAKFSKSFLALVSFCMGTIFFSVESAQAQHNHTPNVCAEDQMVCAHLGHFTQLTSNGENQFIAHIMTKDGTAVEKFKLVLWMDMGGHGHGSSPVTVTASEEPNHFQITRAYFPMAGQWLVRIYFEYQAKAYKLEIPVQVD